VAAEIIWRGTHIGPLALPGGVTLSATGRPFEMHGALFSRWSDGRLVHERHHIDIMSLLAQLGALPAA
jgi:predicted ester cyclase